MVLCPATTPFCGPLHTDFLPVPSTPATCLPFLVPTPLWFRSSALSPSHFTCPSPAMLFPQPPCLPSPPSFLLPHFPSCHLSTHAHAYPPAVLLCLLTSATLPVPGVPSLGGWMFYLLHITPASTFASACPLPYVLPLTHTGTEPACLPPWFPVTMPGICSSYCPCPLPAQGYFPVFTLCPLAPCPYCLPMLETGLEICHHPATHLHPLPALFLPYTFPHALCPLPICLGLYLERGPTAFAFGRCLYTFIHPLPFYTPATCLVGEAFAKGDIIYLPYLCPLVPWKTWATPYLPVYLRVEVWFRTLPALALCDFCGLFSRLTYFVVAFLVCLLPPRPHYPQPSLYTCAARLPVHLLWFPTLPLLSFPYLFYLIHLLPLFPIPHLFVLLPSFLPYYQGLPPPSPDCIAPCLYVWSPLYYSFFPTI